MTPDEAIAKLKTLPEDKQRAVLMQLSPDERKGILAKLQGTTAQTTAQTPSAFRRFGSGYAHGLGIGTAEEGKRFFTHPIETIKGMGEAQANLGRQAGRELKSGDYIRGVTHGIEYLIPGMGPTLAEAGEQLEKGDVAGGVGTTLGAGTLVAVPVEKLPAAAGKLRAAALERAQGVTRRLTEATQASREAVKGAIEDQSKALADRKAAIADTVEKNRQAEGAAKREFDQSKIKTAEKNKAIEESNAAQQREFESQTARRTELERTVEQQSKDLGTKIEDVQKQVKAEADRKFTNVRSRMAQANNGQIPTDEPGPVVQSVKDAESNILQNVPENIKEFRAILKLEEEEKPLMVDGREILPTDPAYQQVREAYASEGIMPSNEPVTWDKYQRLKTSIERKLRSRSTSPIVKRALGSVRDTIVERMGNIAERGGAKAEWEEARNFYRQYKEDFEEPRGPSGSGSPVAAALDAVDPKNIRQPFLAKQGPLGNRGVEILRRYPQFGGNEAATLAEDMVRNHGEMQGIKPKEPTAKATKPIPESYETPKHGKFPPKPEAPVVDLDQASRDAIAKTAERIGRLNAWDARILASSAIAGILSPFIGVRGGVEIGATYVFTKYALARALDNPKVVEWIAKTPPDELAALQKLPNAQLVKIKATLTQMAQQGKVTPSPQLARFLGVAAASGQSNVRNRRDALAAIGRPAP